MMVLTELFENPMAFTALLGILCSTLLYWYSTRNYNYWKDRGIPYIKPIPFFGSMGDIMSLGVVEAVLRRYKSHGPLHGFFELSKPVLSVADPDLIKDILVKDYQYFTSKREMQFNDKIADRLITILSGEDWKRVRSLLSPVFSTGKIKRVFSIFKESSETLVQNFKNAAKKGENIDVKRLYGAFTMDVIANAAFSMKIDSHNDPDNEFARRGRDFFSPKLMWRFIIFAVAPRLMTLLGFTLFPKGEFEFFKDVIDQVISERRRTGEVRNDFLQLLMDATKEIEDDDKSDVKETNELLSNYGEGNTTHHIFKSFKDKRLTMDELVAQSVNFFISGYETSAATVAFATYLLALNPEVQHKLRKEVADVLEDGGGHFTYENVQNMKYLDNVISETLRIYPILAGIERRASADYNLGDTGLVIPKGMLVHIPIYAIQTDPKYFPNPEKFDPERFSLEERKKRHPYVYLPFAAGPRNCVAMRFALMEIKVCLAQVVANFEINRCSETEVPLVFQKNIGFLQPKHITLELKCREK